MPWIAQALKIQVRTGAPPNTVNLVFLKGYGGGELTFTAEIHCPFAPFRCTPNHKHTRYTNGYIECRIVGMPTFMYIARLVGHFFSDLGLLREGQFKYDVLALSPVTLEEHRNMVLIYP